MLHRILLLCFLIVTGTGYSTSAFDDGHNKPKQTKGLHFIENKGQVTDQHGVFRNDIDFKVVAANGLNLFIGKGQLHYQWVKTGSAVNNAIGAPAEMYRMDVQLLGSNPHATITTEDKLAFHQRYYLPTTGSTGATAHTYHKITYHDIYPNIDWTFYFNGEGKLEHDFVVRPGGKVSDIRLQYKGETGLALNKNGSLTAITPMGTVNESSPYAYEQGSKKKIAATFNLDNDILSFFCSPYQGTLVIDPTLEWGTYFGGEDSEDILDIVYNKDGFLYVTGRTLSLTNIATTGAYQSSNAGGYCDAMLAKFDITGNCLWATYYGTADNESAESISNDTIGNLYIAGLTTSLSGLSSTGSQQPVSGGGDDAFIAKFDTSGIRVWGTYYGGENSDATYGAVALHCDRFNNVFLLGQTNSSTGIATAGAYQPDLYGGAFDVDAYLVKFNDAGSLLWCTYYGGNYGEGPTSVTCDTMGNVYITGNTNSTEGIATIGSQQTTNAGFYDAFIAKFSPTGGILWGRFFGGEDYEGATSISTDNSANIYLTGVTASTTGLTTPGSYQDVLGGSTDAYLTKLSTYGDVVWSTYYGGTGDEYGLDIQPYGDSAVYIGGITSSPTDIATNDGIQTTLNSSGGGYLSRFSIGSGSLVWGSYLGGTDGATVKSLDIDQDQNIYIAGSTASSTFISTPGTYQELFGGGPNDGFLMKVKDCNIPLQPDTITGPTVICVSSSNTYHVSPAQVGATSYIWVLPAGWSGNSSVDSIEITGSDNGGTIKVIALNECAQSDTVTLTVAVNPLPVPVIVMNNTVLSTTQPFDSYQWYLDGQPVAAAISATYIPVENGVYTVKVTNGNGCEGVSAGFNFDELDITSLLSQNGISIYPNPIHDVVYINTPIKAGFSIYTVDGRKLATGKLSTGTNQIDIRNLQAGHYKIRLTDYNGKSLGVQQLVKSMP